MYNYSRNEGMYRLHNYEEFWQQGHPKSSNIFILHTLTLKKEVKCAFKTATQLNSTVSKPQNTFINSESYEILNHMEVCVCEEL